MRRRAGVKNRAPLCGLPQRISGDSATFPSTAGTVPATADSNKDHTTMTSHINRKARRRHALAMAGALAVTLLLGLRAGAVEAVPSSAAQEVLIKTSLLTLNDAIVSGNYTVLHAKLAKPFREQFDPDRLKQAFKSFADQKIDMAAISAAPPVASGDAQIDDRGALLLRGRFEVGRSRVTYELDFVQSEGEWKPLGLNVNFKPMTAGGM